MTLRRTEVPWVRADQMRRADELAESKYHLDLLQMMENAGLQLARLARERARGGRLVGASVVVLAGPGGNGGGGLAAARRLSAWGASVQAALGVEEDKLASTTRRQLSAARAAGVELLDDLESAPPPDAILDGYLGYSGRGSPRSPMDAGVRWANASSSPVLALDVPTGLDPDSGEAADPAIRATLTLTLALPKSGLLAPAAQSFVGELWLADISLPPRLFAEIGVEVPSDLFNDGELVRLTE